MTDIVIPEAAKRLSGIHVSANAGRIDARGWVPARAAFGRLAGMTV
jgi:hypothetical protein